MAATETTSGDIGPPSFQSTAEVDKDLVTPDIHSVSIKIKRADDVYKEFAGIQEQPSNGEIFLWYLYSFCSDFVHSVLVPILFPLIISRINPTPTSPPEQGCYPKEMEVYEGLVESSVKFNNHSFTPLEWTSISWATGIFLGTPILAYISRALDNGHYQNLIFGAATALGSIFCLPAGSFRTHWIFPPYIAAIVAASIVTTASHTRHLGVMIRGFSKPVSVDESHNQFPERRSVASWLSLHSTAVGSLGGGIMSAFIYNMLHHKDKFLSLWVVSIFSGLKWIVGSAHAFSVNRRGLSTSNSNLGSHLFSIFKYPHALGSLAAIMLSSFTSTCLFTGGTLYVIGQLCVRPAFMLFLWLTYFIFPLFSLPILHPLQQLAKTDAMRMQLLGFLVSATTSALGFYYRTADWYHPHILLMVAVQSTATGILHAFGRVLLLDCTPAGKEGAFSVWFSWTRAVGACAGFAVASAYPGKVNKSFAFTFCTSLAGLVLLIFGNVSNYGGAVAAGHVIAKNTERSSPIGERRDSGVVEAKV
ncbi:hypothetical protein ACHQM5_027500 [Ranunculus cassubicifolius]